MSKILVLIADCAGASAREGVDAALAALAYEHVVSVLLVGDGVTLVADQQSPLRHGTADLSRMLAACVHHGVEMLAASEACLDARGIKVTQPAVHRIKSAMLSSLIGDHDHVLRF